MKRFRNALILAVVPRAPRCLRGRRAGQAGAREHAEVRAGAADRSRPAPRRRVAERRAQRRVLLAARRHARESRGDRLPRGRERLQGGDDGAHRGARGEGLRARSSGASSRTTRRCRTACAATGTTRATRPARSTRSMRARPARWTRPSRSCSTSTGWRRATGSSRCGSTAIAPDNNLLAFTEDPVGRRQYTLRVKNLATGELLPDRDRERRAVPRLDRRQPQHPVPREGPGDAARPARAPPRARHRPGAGRARLRAGRRELLHRASAPPRTSVPHRSSRAARCPPRCATRTPTDPALAFRVFLPRERDLEYYVDHLDGRWIIRTNWQAPNFRLMEATVGEEGDRANWRELLAHREDAFVRRLRRVQRLPRHRGALGRDAQDPHPALGRRQGLLHRLRRARLHDEPRRERRDRHAASCATSTPR